MPSSGLSKLRSRKSTREDIEHKEEGWAWWIWALIILAIIIIIVIALCVYFYSGSSEKVDEKPTQSTEGSSQSEDIYDKLTMSNLVGCDYDTSNEYDD